MARTVIGICAALERARWGVWDQPAALLGMAYIEAVQRAGALAVILPPDEVAEREPDQPLALLDGLMLARGARRRRARPRHQVAPPPGRRPPRRRARRQRVLDARRASGGDRAPAAPLRARRAVASRGRPGQRRDRRLRARRGRGVRVAP